MTHTTFSVGTTGSLLSKPFGSSFDTEKEDERLLNVTMRALNIDEQPMREEDAKRAHSISLLGSTESSIHDTLTSAIKAPLFVRARTIYSGETDFHASSMDPSVKWKFDIVHECLETLEKRVSKSEDYLEGFVNAYNTYVSNNNEYVTSSDSKFNDLFHRCNSLVHKLQIAEKQYIQVIKTHADSHEFFTRENLALRDRTKKLTEENERLKGKLVALESQFSELNKTVVHNKERLEVLEKIVLKPTRRPITAK